MELKAKGSFYRDLGRLANRELAIEVQKILGQIRQAKDISQIPNLKKLKKFDVHYRIRVMENYRMGLVIRSNKVILVCLGHRHTFYKSFP